MDPITIIEGEELVQLIRSLTGWPGVDTAYRLRIHQGSDGRLKYKTNENTWTYWVGQQDNA